MELLQQLAGIMAEKKMKGAKWPVQTDRHFTDSLWQTSSIILNSVDIYIKTTELGIVPNHNRKALSIFLFRSVRQISPGPTSRH
jgi:hypothetical protein